LRNLLYDNPQNQAVVEAMKRQASAAIDVGTAFV
jgi:hypothetical protein